MYDLKSDVWLDLKRDRVLNKFILHLSHSLGVKRLCTNQPQICKNKSSKYTIAEANCGGLYDQQNRKHLDCIHAFVISPQWLM